MTVHTEYEKLLKDESFCLAEITEVKKLLRQLQYDLKKARTALVKYETLSVAYISDTLVVTDN
ncbi:hypothetical protein [Mucilaginibacter dorajii]|uniref:Uncharacterized protein n=1 Tax=Mucilaginibacter dorajii TaxID=692994 RepID=A0ABP7PR75_9SPHI|nr:hypothetical protein [Mucilaginibacter dorajii]MCS3736926.1 hypothetical protein [Mucilaginibacter dorajii]